MTHRRDFLRSVPIAALGLAGASPARYWLRPRFDGYPFSLGVASGDPAADGFVIWTRLAPDPLRGGGMPPETVEVGWEIAADDAMRRIVRRGTAAASPELAHSVHVEVAGLEPGRPYWYWFRVANATSPVGRAITMRPAGAAPPSFRFAFVSCQHYEHGWYTAYRHLVNDGVELVAHLGDYIYEGAGIRESIRMHPGGELMTLADYRNRYALYKTDPDLQAAHAHCPWVATWDDHEVDNNYAGAISQGRDPVEQFLVRRAAAYQAWYEHLPVRASARPRGPDARLYRTIDAGGLARFFVLDTRQYRTDQPCGDRRQAPCPERLAPESTMLGAEQERWLVDGLARSDARWNVLAQQVFMAHEDVAAGPEEAYFMDSWNGYPASRARLLDAVARRGRGNTVVLTGDVHSSWVCDLHRDPREPGSRPVATELVGTSITTDGDGADTYRDAPAILAENPHIRFHDARRGYVVCTVAPSLWRADYRIVPYVSQPDAPIVTKASFVVEHGRPGIQAG